ncbi:hypothetical protein Tco_0252611 [Tanacetum coccineum]
MNDPNITMEEYIRLEEEKAQSRGETFNWKNATFGRIRHYYEEERFTNFKEEFLAIVFGKIKRNSFNSEQGGIMGEYDDERENFETEFPAIVINNTSNTTPPCEPTVSPPNENQIDFRISLDEYDDEDYTPTVSCINDLDFFKDFENEFPAIVYNDALTSKSDFSTKPVELKLTAASTISLVSGSSKGKLSNSSPGNLKLLRAALRDSSIKARYSKGPIAKDVVTW